MTEGKLITRSAPNEAPTEPKGAYPEVCILLSVYNGARYLGEQLESFRAQSGVAWKLYWRDDGSTDGSVAIMRAFAADRPVGQCHEIRDTLGRVGVGAAYQLLLAASPANHAVAFADQDDVWLPEKLARACSELRDTPRPALYCARQYICDAQLTKRQLSPRLPDGHHLTLARALTQNIAVGHTVVLNPAAANLLRRCPVPQGGLHDWWSYLVVAAVGGVMRCDNAPVSLYRQHGSNLVGAASTTLVRGLRALHRGPEKFMRRFSRNVDALHGLFCVPQIESGRTLEIGGEISGNTADMLENLKTVLQHGAFRRFMFLMMNRDLRRQGFLENGIFFLWFLIFGGQKARRQDA